MKKQFLGAAFITVISASALAEDSVAAPFNELDINSDNALSVAETMSLPDMSAQWNELDKNGDGQLDSDEYKAYQLPAPAAGTN